MLHIILFEPEIPPNTGNIARLCACTDHHLHLVHPLGFSIDAKQVRRAGLDYWQHLQLSEHDNWEALKASFPQDQRFWALSTKASQSIWQTQFEDGDALVLGPETRGLPANILEDIQGIKIPMRDNAPVRSLNLSNACAVVIYEAMRQIEVSS
ncbi:MAG: tRNA (cytidine(34)-2'-O)-methyltransferase [Mariprofundaceae bacterium]|nr:tRNA (cytidine(34)-2'-O)-methyltransferase [Mariprofundaceae bacterium]